jgi:transforming growth factor-beta-induced protein
MVPASVLVAFCLALGASAGAAAQTVVDLAVATPDLSTLVTALAAANLVDTLSGRGPWTVFAPTNEAFALLPPADLEFLLDPENIDKLVSVLTYHVKTDRLRAEDLQNGQQLETVQGDDVGVTILERSGRVFIGDGEVTTADIGATNGIVHIIDRVLLPPGGGGERPSASIVQLAGTTPELFVLATALRAADLEGTLSGGGPFTVFAPTNDAFRALPEGTLEFLLEPENKDDLIDVLTYHVASGEARAASLCNGQRVPTLEGEDVTVTILGGRVFINDSQVEVADVLASNGVVHIIDEVLLPADELKKLAAKVAAASKQAVLL